MNDWTNTTSTANTTRVFIRTVTTSGTATSGTFTYPYAPLARWSFGTIVHHKDDLRAQAMILTDDGTLVRVLTLPEGETVQAFRSVWEPDTP